MGSMMHLYTDTLTDNSSAALVMFGHLMSCIHDWCEHPTPCNYVLWTTLQKQINNWKTVPYVGRNQFLNTVLKLLK